MPSSWKSLLVCLLSGRATLALQSQNDTFNSTFRLTAQQISTANLSAATTHNVEVALQYERSNNAGSLVQNEPFYIVPDHYNLNDLPPPGTILKVEAHTNLTLYTIPNSLSLSRFLYVSESYNGTSLPASLRLHPLPLYPVVALAHGTSGQTQACAPSGLRNLWDHFNEPFPLALQGYAVVTPDYAGLGVPNVTSPYFVFPAQANDLFHAVAAAQSEWPSLLSREFVVAGQSQGGGVAWAAAQRQYSRPVKGYLGTMAASPFTDALAAIAADSGIENNGRVSGIAQGLASVLPGFQMSDWLTTLGVARWNLIHEIHGCGTTSGQLAAAESGALPILKEGWNETWSADWFRKATMNGGKPFAGPMLVIQGTEDGNANEPTTSRSINQTCELFPESQLQYIRFENITHVPVLLAGQHTWLGWIHDRFAGVAVPEGCTQQTLSPPRGINGAASAGWSSATWFVEYNLYGI
ncbi:hypothetical protein LTR01_005468 [Friedmanniomyces endolithicus]|nr:hypothetical protein LTR01_005468 [Friedmanniomyces endolithicus]KAK0824002.1 hypothetical protein LTR73_008038 [Friedmanniomyces endolithicus]